MIGRSLAPFGFAVTDELLAAYAKAIAAPAGAPPLLPFLLPAAFGPTRRQLAPDLPVLTFLHLVGGEVDMKAGDAAIAAGDELTTACRVADVRNRIQGDLWVVDVATTNQRGELVGEARLTFLVPPTRDERRLITDTLPPLLSRPQRAIAGEADFATTRPIEADDAVAGGDFFRAETAALGHAAAAIVAFAGGGPTRLRRLSAKVNRSVMFGRSLAIRGKRVESGRIAFESIDEKGFTVLTDGVAELIE